MVKKNFSAALRSEGKQQGLSTPELSLEQDSHRTGRDILSASDNTYYVVGLLGQQRLCLNNGVCLKKQTDRFKGGE